MSVTRKGREKERAGEKAEHGDGGASPFIPLIGYLPVREDTPAGHISICQPRAIDSFFTPAYRTNV